MRLSAPLRPLFFLPFLCAANPKALPEADPLPAALPEAVPEALPEAEADPHAEAQSYTNNAPFSGAIYIVNPNGQQVTAQGTNYCPSYASVSCGSMGAPSWCCPNSYTCASVNNIVGCCPSGQSCSGSVNAAAVTTITVQAAQQTSYVYVQPSTTYVYQQPTTQVVYTQQTTAAVYAAGGYCSTLTMNGPGLPTTTQGSCGTILIVNEGAHIMKTIGYGFGAVVILLHVALGRLFHRH